MCLTVFERLPNVDIKLVQCYTEYFNHLIIIIMIIYTFL